MTPLPFGCFLAGMKIHSLLIVVDKMRDATHLQEKSWQSFSGRIESILQTAKGIERLSENVFLIPLDNGISPASLIFEAASRHELKYRVLFFEEEPEWVLSDA